MPRRRRVDKRKSIRKLDSRIWRYLKDEPEFESSMAGDSTTFLMCCAIEQGIPRRGEIAFWREIRAAVLAGEIDVADEVQHTSEDARLLLSTSALA